MELAMAVSQRNRWKDAATGKVDRHHLDPSLVQKAVKQAVQLPGLSKPAGCPTSRHSFATHLPKPGQDILTIQELIGALGSQYHHDLHPRTQARVDGAISPADLVWQPLNVDIGSENDCLRWS